MSEDQPQEPQPQQHRSDFHVAGVGASAGGVDALEKFFGSAPAGAGIAYIVVQHLSPSAKSHLGSILEHDTSLPVSQAADGMRLEADHVYTIPPDRFLAVADGRLRLSEPFKESGRRLPIDYLFRSLAEAVGRRAIGVVLSGSGADGSLGIREVHAAGGLAVAQDPATAQYASMPEQAVRTGVVDFVLPPEEIPGALVSYISHGLTRAGAALRDPEDLDTLERILDLLAQRTGRDYSAYKRSTVGRRIQRRMGVNETGHIKDYLDLLQRDEEETARLAREMLIGVTSFFREPEAFEVLGEEALRDLVRQKSQGDQFRVWVPGCSTGEEAYSIAILLQELQAEEGCRSELQVFGTDLDRDAVETARAGRYPENIAADVSKERLERFFVEGDGSYTVAQGLREQVVFAPHNLLREPPFSNLDLISCRNVLIYLRPEAQQKVLQLCAWGLREDGILFLGTSDNVTAGQEYFDAVSTEYRIYARNEQAGPAPPNFAGRRTARELPRTGREEAQAPSHGLSAVELAELNQRVLLQHYDAAVALVGPGGRVVHFFGSTYKYLQHPSGVANLDIETLAEETLSAKLSPALERAWEERTRVELRGVRFSHNGHPALVDITLRPVRARPDCDLMAVIFEEPEPDAGAVKGTARPTARDESEVVRQLRMELRSVKEDHRVTVQELERANEDLRAANEEVTSMNEELQATNEELQSSQEELQSLNEELQTLNDQLNDKIRELNQANNDLINLFRAIDLPTLFVDADLRIKRMGETATRIFRVRPSDTGRPLQDITNTLLDAEPAAAARQVLENLGTVERRVQSEDGRRYMMRVVPYRTEDNRIDGVVMTFFDVTGLVETEDQLRSLNRTLEERVEERTRLASRRAERLQKLAVRLTRTEQRERNRLAEILHDELQQSLAMAQLQLRQLQDSADEEPLRKRAERLHSVVADAIRTARTLTAELCPRVLYEQGLEDALKWLSRHTEDHYGLKVSVETSPYSEPGSETVKTLLFRCAQELLVNVAKHAEADEATVRLSRTDEEEIMLEVVDRGRGFETEGVLGPQQDAAGFGLFSIHERAEAVGGRMEVHSEPRSGTRVVVVLPPTEELVEGEQGEEERAERISHGFRAEGAYPDSSCRVVVADDHGVVRRSLVNLLEDTGRFTVVGQAANGLDAVEVVLEEAPDVVLMDVSMPDIDGVEAVRRIRKAGVESAIIGLSVHGEDEIIQAMLEAGADAYVNKAEDLQELLDALDKYSSKPR
ncbi:MAG: chemotaxis protein CheB [Candidatus Brocadiia bacterium]